MSDKSIDRIILACAAIWALVAVAACLGGCAPTYTVVAADREAVPVRQTQEAPRTYEEAVEGATGWYVPDAVLLDLLDAD